GAGISFRPTNKPVAQTRPLESSSRSKDHWDFEAVEAHLGRAHAVADFTGNQSLFGVAPDAEPNCITPVQARERFEFVHVVRHPPAEAEVLADDKIVPKPVFVLVELPGFTEMRVARTATSELRGLGNRHSVAVEVVGLGTPGERHGESENSGVDRSEFRP